VAKTLTYKNIMKYLSMTILFFATIFTGYSQSIISNVIPNFGDQFVIDNQEAALSPGMSGANVTWDFSDQTIGESVESVVMPAGEVDGSEYFPDASMAWVINIADFIMASYFGFDNNTFTSYGTNGMYAGVSSGVIYSDPADSFTYPLEYQDTGSDAYAGSIINIGDSLYGSQTYIVDGWGTVITPFGNYPNVLRVTETSVETIQSTLTVITTRTNTSWYSPEFPIPVLVIRSDYSHAMEMPLDSSQTISALVSYTPASTTGLSSRNDQIAFRVFPNPVSDQITVTFDNEKPEAVLNIYSSTGKMVETRSIKSDQKVDVSGLAPGIYIAALYIDGERYAQTPFSMIR